MQIAQHYLLSSPPAQFHEVLSGMLMPLKPHSSILFILEIPQNSPFSLFDHPFGFRCSKVTPGWFVDGPVGHRHRACLQYQEWKSCDCSLGQKGYLRRVSSCLLKYSLISNGSGQVVLSLPGEVDHSHYIDPTDGSVFGIDHLSLVNFVVSQYSTSLVCHWLTDTSFVPSQVTTDDPVPVEVNQALELNRASYQAAVERYVAANFKPEESATSVYSTADGHIAITISSEKPNLRNFWAGKWTSTWIIQNASTSSAKISGTIKVSCALRARLD